MTTRPDFANTANILSSFVENPENKHWNAPKACLCYLKGTKSEEIIFRKCDKLDLKGFSDSDWAGNLDSRKSVSGYCFRVQEQSAGLLSYKIAYQPPQLKLN